MTCVVALCITGPPTYSSGGAPAAGALDLLAPPGFGEEARARSTAAMLPGLTPLIGATPYPRPLAFATNAPAGVAVSASASAVAAMPSSATKARPGGEPGLRPRRRDVAASA